MIFSYVKIIIICYCLLTGLEYPSAGAVPTNRGCRAGFEASRSLEVLRIALTW